MLAPSNPCTSLLECSAERVQSERSQDAQTNGQRLAGLDGARNGAAGENERSQQSKLDTVGIAVLNAQAAEDV